MRTNQGSLSLRAMAASDSDLRESRISVEEGSDIRVRVQTAWHQSALKVCSFVQKKVWPGHFGPGRKLLALKVLLYALRVVQPLLLLLLNDLCMVLLGRNTCVW